METSSLLHAPLEIEQMETIELEQMEASALLPVSQSRDTSMEMSIQLSDTSSIEVSLPFPELRDTLNATIARNEELIRLDNWLVYSAIVSILCFLGSVVARHTKKEWVIVIALLFLIVTDGLYHYLTGLYKRIGTTWRYREIFNFTWVVVDGLIMAFFSCLPSLIINKAKLGSIGILDIVELCSATWVLANAECIFIRVFEDQIILSPLFCVMSMTLAWCVEIEVVETNKGLYLSLGSSLLYIIFGLALQYYNRCFRVGEENIKREIEAKAQRVKEIVRERKMREKDEKIKKLERELTEKDREIALLDRLLREKDGEIEGSQRRQSQKDREIEVLKEKLREKDAEINVFQGKLNVMVMKLDELAG